MKRFAAACVALVLLATISGALEARSAATGSGLAYVDTPAAKPAETSTPTDDERKKDEGKGEEMTPAERRLLIKKYYHTRGTMGLRPARKAKIEDMPIKDALEFLGEIGRFNIVFDPALEAQGIDLDTPRVNVNLTGVTFGNALKLLLPREAGYKVGPGYILITTLEKSWKPLAVRSYSIKLILAKVPDFTGAPRFDLGSIGEQDPQGGGFEGLFGDGGGIEEEGEEIQPEQIIELIQRHVTHDSNKQIAPWDVMGGPASIQYMSGKIIVSQTPAGHRAVLRVISMLGG